MLALSATLSAAAQSSFTIGFNLSQRYQTIMDFGASDCWTSDYVGRYFSASEKEKAARLLFSQKMDNNGNPEGIGLSVWRVNLGAGSSQQGDGSNISDATRRADCYIKKETSDVTFWLGRPWGSGTPTACFINTKMDANALVSGFLSMERLLFAMTQYDTPPGIERYSFFSVRYG